MENEKDLLETSVNADLRVRQNIEDLEQLQTLSSNSIHLKENLQASDR
jgi:hypothetical protein